MRTRVCHTEMFMPEQFQTVIQKASGRKPLTFTLEQLARRGVTLGTKGHITDPETGNCVLVVSDASYTGRLQIRYCYAKNTKDFTGGIPRYGSAPENIAAEIVRMLKEKNCLKVRFELEFGKKETA